MSYLFWDTERIRNTKIYMSAIILTDSSLNVVKQELVIDSSIDVSRRHSPKSKVLRLKDNALIFNSFTELASWIKQYIDSSTVVCFGKDDFLALNDQLKIHNLPIVEGSFYDLQLYGRNCERFSNLSKVADFFGIKHDAHNPLSDAQVTLELFKYLQSTTDIGQLIKPIPNKKSILDIEVNGTISKK